MKNSEKLIKNIYSQVWMYNEFHDNYEDWHTQLSDDTKEIAPIIKNYCVSIINAKSETSKLVKDAVENIYKYARPKNYKESYMNIKYPDTEDYISKNPQITANNILDYINELLEAVKSEDDISVNELNEKWKHKWLYFNGDESGQEIIRINKIHYVNTDYYGYQLAFDGSIIKFLNENNSAEGCGVAVKEVENELFGNLYYIEYIDEDAYDYEANDDEEYSDDWRDPKKLEAALSSKPLDTDLDSRVLTDAKVKEMIAECFFDEEYGCIVDKCYDL